jgi:hypothetical protein
LSLNYGGEKAPRVQEAKTTKDHSWKIQPPKAKNKANRIQMKTNLAQKGGGRSHLCLSQMVWHREELSLGP